MMINRTTNLSIDINGPPTEVFSVLCDLRGYSTWLPQNGNYKGTVEVSDGPVKTGTKYMEYAPNGTRHGEVLGLDETAGHVIFHQPHTFKPAFLGLVLDITVDEIVKEKEGGGSVLERQLRIGIPLAMGMLAGWVVNELSSESMRTIRMLKEHIEKSET